MIYTAFSMNGTWKMNYQEENYTSEVCPGFKGITVRDAVPGFWEDMTEKFKKTEFYRHLRINPEFGIQEYPIADVCPDMALPNIMGNFFYSRVFTCENINGAATLYFGGVQSAASVWLNGSFLGRHEGYSSPFEVAIPEGVLRSGENTVVLSVSNHRLEGFDDQPVSGITSRAASEYSGGITGDIELRVYNSPLRDVAVLVSEDCKSISVRMTAVEPIGCTWAVLDGEKTVKSGSCDGDFAFDTDGLELWSPESPKRYTLQIKCGEAVYERLFGVRRLTVDGVHLRLNGKPYYLRGICEHCYYPETVHLNHDLTFYRNVIKKLKQLGFNFIRFHTHIPTAEYLQAADELGMLMHVETPNNTSYDEWVDIVNFCRNYTSVVVYCGGNELQIHDAYLAHLQKCADLVHENTDSLFSPMSALRGFEYALGEPDQLDQLVDAPFKHHPRRFREAKEFVDLYNSYSLGYFSYFSQKADPEKVSSWSEVYGKPRVTHEICIDGTYTDLSLKDRYKGTLVGKTDMFSSIERHLEEKGLLKKAPTYFANSSEWQRRSRKYCFEAVRRCENMAGYDFLGPIDTHWHTFGYDVGMMNEFYEMKPGETVRNVLMYNSETVLLNDLGLKTNFKSGETLSCNILTSYYGAETLQGAELNVRLSVDGKAIARKRLTIDGIESGSVAVLCDFEAVMPDVEKPAQMKLAVTLENDDLYAENEWELYLFPVVEAADKKDLLVANGISEADLMAALEEGKDVVILGANPFVTNETSCRIGLAGRTSGHVATVVADHPLLCDLPHEGFCGWQFASLLEGGRAAILEHDTVPFDPIIDIAPPHKNVIRQATLFEYKALNGRLLVCTFAFKDSDPAAAWLKNEMINYANSDLFDPAISVTCEQLHELLHPQVVMGAGNTNLAFNPNDKTAVRKKK